MDANSTREPSKRLNALIDKSTREMNDLDHHAQSWFASVLGFSENMAEIFLSMSIRYWAYFLPLGRDDMVRTKK